ncbi:MAG: HEAT repeat domain-containing protein [Planctomycetota bacterium]
MKPSMISLLFAFMVIVLIMAVSRWNSRDSAPSPFPGGQSTDTPRPRFVTGGQGADIAMSTERIPAHWLTRLLREWPMAVEKRREHILVAIREALPEISELLLSILTTQARTLVAAIEVSGRLEFPPAVPLMRPLVAAEEPLVRGAAILAVNRMHPWSKEDLGTFLKDPDSEPKLAALRVCLEREDLPIEEILFCLADGDPEVREAAVRAMPERLESRALQQQLLDLAQGERIQAALSSIQALGTVYDFPGKEKVLLETLKLKNMHLRLASLQALSLMENPLQSTLEIRRRILDRAASVEEKVACFLVLEQTESVDRTWMAAVAGSLHPVLNLHAARCLVSVGDPRGAEVLIRLLTAREGAESNCEDIDYVQIASRKILAQLAGRDLGEDPAAWRRSLPRMRQIGPVRIRFQPWKTW